MAQLPSRNSLVFSLKQNFGPQLANGRLYYVESPNGIVERLTPIFFIGIGQSKLITGPYELTSDIMRVPAMDTKNMTRLNETNIEYGIWQEMRVACQFYVSFRPLVEIEKGIIWNEQFCEEYGLDIKSWGNLAQVSLTEAQINKLAEELTKINTPI